MRSFPALCVAAVCGLAPAPRAHAVEGALGHTITGQQITSFAGIIPPDPGFIWQLGYIHYSGDIGGGRETPIGGVRALNLSATADIVAPTAVYVWNTPKGRWNFASVLAVPFISLSADADSTIGPFATDLHDSDSGLFDVTFVPVIASYHVSEMEHWSLALYVYAPTGEYTAGKLANPGLNIWTFSPTVGYTHLYLKGGIEVSVTGAVDFNGENPATDYDGGDVFRLEALSMLRTPKGWGVGIVAGWLDQITGDEAPNLPASLNGFRGHSLAAGPAFTYTTKFAGGTHFDVNFRWMFEFDTQDRFNGDGPQLNFALHH
ncbi:MAG TPA: transporter [Steroidobacteraceae bacterium]|nr:transporter [Steroidobacteraceae bacterium]